MQHETTMRDHFAAAALTGLLAGRKFTALDDAIVEEAYAEAAYGIADAMLRKRGNQPEPPDSSPVTEPMPKRKRAEVSVGEPVAWAVRHRHGDTGIVDLCRTLADCRARWSNRTTDYWLYEPLYRQPQPALTDEEREAVESAAEWAGQDGMEQIAATLRGLLERTR